VCDRVFLGMGGRGCVTLLFIVTKSPYTNTLRREVAGFMSAPSSKFDKLFIFYCQFVICMLRFVLLSDIDSLLSFHPFLFAIFHSISWRNILSSLPKEIFTNFLFSFLFLPLHQSCSSSGSFRYRISSHNRANR
jgi:sensor histidine kinase YesM